MSLKINKFIDHTNLKADATKKDIETLCKEALSFDFASVCVYSTWVKFCYDLLKNSSVKVCTVVGFPSGATNTEAKIAETIKAIEDGATEIDMVINIGWLKDKKYDLVLEEIKQIKKACKNNILKVIIETGLLNNEEKIKMCEIVTNAGADFIKTSTGMISYGASVEDIELFKNNIGANVKIKASGGVSTNKKALQMIDAGANRIGTSKGPTLIK